MTAAAVAAALLALAALLAAAEVRRRRKNVKEVEAVRVLLEMGADVAVGTWHVYRGLGPKGEPPPYVILHFTKDGKLTLCDEESFTDAGDAAAKFLLRTRA